jgi:hypothetical protein
MSFKKAQSKDDAPVTFSNHLHIACKHTQSTKHKEFLQHERIAFYLANKFFVEQINYKI